VLLSKANKDLVYGIACVEIADTRVTDFWQSKFFGFKA
jgi:regulation of enolase protein 1 (concanavalin A-like superfamily)